MRRWPTPFLVLSLPLVLAVAGCGNGAARGTTTAPLAPPSALSATAVLLNPENVEESLAALGFQLPSRRQPASDFQLIDMDGQVRALSDLEGEIVFLNFWATWCAPCRLEMPDMEGLHQALGGAGLHMVAVNLREEAVTIRPFISNLELTFDVYLDSDGAVGRAYGASVLPMTYLIDRDGTVLARAIGARQWEGEEIRQMFRALLGRSAAELAG